jgi:bifunctional ADP-heptose synthase (sugar kinase/adenylyltransferase)
MSKMNPKIYQHCQDLKHHLQDICKNSDVMIFSTSGGFDPIHIGHLKCFQDMKSMTQNSLLPGVSAKTVVIVNGDGFLKRKKGYAFMPAMERAEIIAELECVDYVTFWDDGTQYVTGALRILRPDFFCKGGDRDNERVVPEFKVCEDIGCKVLFNVGGVKLQSSSALVERSKHGNKTYNI